MQGVPPESCSCETRIFVHRLFSFGFRVLSFLIYFSAVLLSPCVGFSGPDKSASSFSSIPPLPSINLVLSLFQPEVISFLDFLCRHLFRVLSGGRGSTWKTSAIFVSFLVSFVPGTG